MVNGVLELGGGLFLSLLSAEDVKRLIEVLLQGELLNDPQDAVATFLLRSSTHITPAVQHGVSVYLLSHGIVKMVLIFSMWKKRPWSYPVFIVLLSLLCLYQMYHFVLSHSILLLVITIYDLFIVWFAWKEYRAKQFPIILSVTKV